jgi:hypothetical protein
MLVLGIGKEKILEFAVAEIIAGDRALTREDLGKIHNIRQQQNAHRLQSIIRDGSILAKAGYEVPLEIVKEISSKDTRGLSQALEQYSLEEVMSLLDKGVYLPNAFRVHKALQERRQLLDTDGIAEMTGGELDGLEICLDTFGLDTTRTFIRHGIHMPLTVEIRNSSVNQSVEMTPPEILRLADGVENPGDFIEGLRNLPLQNMESLKDSRVSYLGYKTVNTALKERGEDSSFEVSLRWAEKLSKQGEIHAFSSALEGFSLAEIDHFLQTGTDLNVARTLQESLREREFQNDIETITKWSLGVEYSWYVNDLDRALKLFGREVLTQIVDAGASWRGALLIKEEIRRRSLTEYDRTEFITQMAVLKQEASALVDTVEAGFSPNEIQKYPYLVSPLVKELGI